MQRTVLLGVLSAWAIFGLFVFLRVRHIETNIANRFERTPKLNNQYRVFHILIFLLWISVAVLISMLTLFIF